MKKVAVAVLAMALLMLFACFTPVYATPANTTHGTTPYGMDYTQVTGTLGDAAYIIQIPEGWNRMLVVACPWY